MATTGGSLRSSTSWLGGTPKSQRSKSAYNTVSGATAAHRPRVGPLFFEDPTAEDKRSRQEVDGPLNDILGLPERWEISLAKSPARARKRDVSLTVYVSTPTSSLTLTRTAADLLDLETRLRSTFGNLIPMRKSTITSAAGTTPRKRSVLASLQRTLSPRRSSHSHSPSTSLSLSVDYHELGSFFTSLSKDPAVRGHSLWRSFFAVGKDDLESARVEKRIKRTVSDATTHLTQPRASVELVIGLGGGTSPAATNGGVHPIEGSSNSSTATEIEETPVSLFPLPSIPSSKLDFEEAAHQLAAGGDRREASSSTVMTDLTTASSDSGAAITIELPTPPAEGQGDPLARFGAEVESPRPPSAMDEEVAETLLSPISEPMSDVSEDTRSATALSVPTTPNRPRSRTPSATKSSTKPVLTIESFEIKRVLGKGCAGKVLLVKEKRNGEIYALKAIHKQHVLAHRELMHTLTEQAVLKASSRGLNPNPFIVKMHYSFHDKDTLYLALDFHPGGDLATQLARWGRLGRDRARFYAAEIFEGVEGLHRRGIIYRDLKPENILISLEGHVVLTDFGLSKDFGHASSPRSTDSASLGGDDGGLPSPRPYWLPVTSTAPVSRTMSSPPSLTWLGNHRETTSTFCGTAEYLAPEVLLGDEYSYEVDAWSLGTMLYEMLAGVTPFWAEDHATMYRRVLHEDLTFDDRARVFDDDTKSLLRGLLQRDPLFRMSDGRIRRHPYFAAIDWDHVYNKRYAPPFVPLVNPDDPIDTSQFDDVFLDMDPTIGQAAAGDTSERDPPEGDPQEAVDEEGKDVFDGYSYYGRDSDSIRRYGQEDDSDDSEDDVVSEDGDKTVESVQHSTQSPDLTMEHDSTPHAGVDITVSTFDSATTEATTAVTASPQSKHVRQTSEEQEDSSISGSASHTSLNSAPVAGVAAVAAAPAIVSSTDVIFEDVQEEEAGEISDSEWDVVGKEDSAVAPLPSSRNGERGASLWARGFKDKYKLAVNLPRGPASPLRPPISRSGSRRGSSHAGSVHSSTSRNPSPTPTPEPRQSPIRRLASMRSSSSNNVPKSSDLRSRRSQRSVTDDGDAALGDGLSTSLSSSALDTPRRAGSTIKRITFSAFRPSRTPSQSS